MADVVESTAPAGDVAGELIYATATELAAGIRAGRISSEEAVRAHLAHIGERNGPLNAVVTLDAEAAMARAREADRALARGEVWGPLHGVPVTIKDWLAVAGMRSTAGLPELVDHIPTEDAVVVARVRAAGAIIMGKTNTPGQGGGYHTGNPVFGLTNNPWGLERSPGGSSGGSAAAVAAGLTPFEVGSDAGGSLRIPAHYCGIYTVKPTERRIPTAGHLTDQQPVASSLRLINCPGPLARSVDDLILGLTIMEGPGGREWEVAPTSLGPLPPLNPKVLRLAWFDDFGVPVTRDTTRVLERLARVLSDSGAGVEREDPGLDSDLAGEAWGGLLLIGAGARAPDRSPDEDIPREPLPGITMDSDEPALRGMARVMSGSLNEYIDLTTIRDAMIGTLEDFFARWDALLCPVAVGPAIRHCPQGTPQTVDEHTVSYWRTGIAYTAPFNLTGHPSVVVPAGSSSEGLPIGIQIVGPRWSEMKMLAIARHVQDLIGPFRRPTGY
jgi:amidase